MRITDRTMYAGEFDIGGWRLWLAKTDRGLCFVGSEEAWSHWRKKEDWVRDDEKLRVYAEQLSEYMQGERTTFTLPLDADGTAFQQSVWKALTEIPFGARVSYTDIANFIGKPSSVRAVGTAIGANPVLIVVPCHRVVGKNGTLTGFREGLEMKRHLLELESRDGAGLGAGRMVK
ncbi:methylated-DNA--[protein]-cysteine S-methyltransferase [Cohnella pontilimi]|uniref:Methylated-DNA--protein-cysteine methyltransferase n=1 Tax=Cohnella pontilimi TaxID=2564100 RepID=A0A4U0FG00_9BACL|nr:methylated-DNA--[protein]-cysteine S-methyltransferase [Cohnella pontilimi]TJY43916.1 methylated-DNA--[protein]-cysteine S-methyltransferase [Cohnella pontilimi]